MATAHAQARAIVHGTLCLPDGGNVIIPVIHNDLALSPASTDLSTGRLTEICCPLPTASFPGGA